MIIILKNSKNKKQEDDLRQWLKSMDLCIHESVGKSHTIFGLIGDTTEVDMDLIKALDIVEDVKRVQESYKKANRYFHNEDSIIDVSGVKIGAGEFALIAGPCSIEGREQILDIAKYVKKSGSKLLRGGAFKPRTSPYSFQGLGQEGIKLLLEAKKETGLPIVSEVMDISELKYFENVDLIQVGARNMQNFTLLKELGKLNKPILLKRGMASTITEILMSAEYIMAGGNENVILCERGIRTFENSMRSTLDLAAIPMLKKKTHLPVVVDPSHATGKAFMVRPMAIAATAAGADGLMIEVHNDPAHAKSDGPQSLKPEEFDVLAKAVFDVLPFSEKYGRN